MGAIDLARFKAAYGIDPGLGSPQVEVGHPIRGTSTSGIDDSIVELLSEIGGTSFAGGLYRTHTVDQVKNWSGVIWTGWTETTDKVTCFASDWLGRQFGLFNGKLVLQFSAGDLEFVEIPCDVAVFHNEILVEHPEEALAQAFYEAWRESGGARPLYSQCIGYKRPLFLGGTDWVDNLEPIDMDVYWTVSAPVIAKARKVGVGGSIGQIQIDQ